MKQAAYHIRIHNLLQMRIRDTVGIADRVFMRPERGYIHHRIAPEQFTKPDIDVRIGAFDFERREATQVDGRYQVDDDYFACQDTYKILWWKLEMSGFNGGTTELRIDRNAFGTAAIGSRIIDCMVRYRLAQRDAPAVHSCGVVGPRGACLLSGRSGAGKSTLAMRLLGQGYRLLGDNWVIVHAGQAYSFHLPVNVHDYNVAPEVYARMSRRLKFTLKAYSLARRASAGFLKKATSLVLRDVLPDYVAEQAPLAKIMTLTQGDALAIRQLDRREGIARLVANDIMDREAFYRYMLAYATVHPESPMARHWRLLPGRLERAIPRGAPFFDVTLPRRITDDTVTRVRQELESA